MNLLNKMGLVKKSDYDALRRMWNNDSRLAASLMEECQRLQRDNDELSDENARLISDNEGAAARIACANRNSDFYMQNAKEAGRVIQDVFEALTDDRSAVSCNNNAVKIINDYGNKRNNDPSNLRVFPSQAEHARWHMLQRYRGGDGDALCSETASEDRG